MKSLIQSEIIPYGEYLYVEPVEKGQVLVSERATLQTYGKVLEIGDEVKRTGVGDVVAFELWDLCNFSLDGKEKYFVKESNVICKLKM